MSLDFGAEVVRFAATIGPSKERLQAVEEHKVHAYVVNLKRSVDRRAAIVAQLSRTNVSYQLVEAREGRELDLDDTRIVDQSRLTDGTLSPGAVGCALSHLDVYRSIVQEGRQRALVLEDDAVVPSDLDEVVEEIADSMSGAEVVLLRVVGRLGSGPCRLSTWCEQKIGTSRHVMFPYHLDQVLSTGAYVITREAAERLAAVVLPVRATADTWDHFHALGAIDSVRCVVPSLVPSNPRFRSTIERYAPETLQGRLRRYVASHPVPLVSDLLIARRRHRQRRHRHTEFVDLRPPWLGAQDGEPRRV